MSQLSPPGPLTAWKIYLYLVASVMGTSGLTQRFPNNGGQDFPDFIEQNDLTPKGERG